MKKLIATALVVATSFCSFAAVPSNGLDPVDALVSGVGPEAYIAAQDVTAIRNYAFVDNRSIQQIVADNALTVGIGAFRGCASLKSVILPSVTDLTKFNSIFAGCAQLTDVKLTAIEFPGKQSGFPWQAPNKSIIFQFKNGTFDWNGNKID